MNTRPKLKKIIQHTMMTTPLFYVVLILFIKVSYHVITKSEQEVGLVVLLLGFSLILSGVKVLLTYLHLKCGKRIIGEIEDHGDVSKMRCIFYKYRVKDTIYSDHTMVFELDKSGQLSTNTPLVVHPKKPGKVLIEALFC
jgi:hypothetical protein